MAAGARVDAHRDRMLASAGYRVLRVAEHEVLSALPHVVARIRAAIDEAAEANVQGGQTGRWPAESAFATCTIRLK